MTAPFLSEIWYRVAAYRPSLAAHAELHRHQYRGRPWYVLQDAVAGRSLKLGGPAYRALALMDGTHSLDAIWRLVVQHHGDQVSSQVSSQVPSQDDMIGFLAKLHGMDLLRGDLPPDALALFDRAERQRRSALWRVLLNPLSVKLPLWNPERFLDATARFVVPLFGRAGAGLWLAFVLPALVLAAQNWDALSADVADHVFAAETMVALALLYPAAKLVHELAHGYAVKAFGGTVTELGVMLLVFFPSPYVDASAASGFRHRSQRIVVGAAGMLAEAVLAAGALYLWVLVEPGILRSLAYNLILIAGVSTVVFNANPLLRYDGYYILADLIEIPNLGQRATRYWGYLAERYAFGAKPTLDPPPCQGERIWLLLYAPSALAYRLSVSVAIALFVAGQYFVVGVLLGAWSLLSGFAVPALKALGHVVRAPSLRRSRARALGVTAAALAGTAAILFLVPLPMTTTTEGVIWLPPDAAVRAGADGFVEALAAEPGQIVRPGELLAETRDPLRLAQAEILRARRDELQLQLHAERFADRIQAEVTRVELGQVGAELAREEVRLARMSVRSPAAGRFVVERAENLPGRFLHEGEIVGYVTPTASPLVRVGVRQDDVDLVRSRLRRAEVLIAGHLDESRPASVLREVPSGHFELPSKALGTAGGGPFGTDPRDSSGLRTMQRVFQFDLALPPDAPATAFGARVHVRFVHDPEPVGLQLYRRGRQLLLSRLHA